MKIASCNVRKENLLLTRPYTIAFKTIDTVENGIIELVSDTGLRGYGAFNPSYEVVGEKLHDALGALQPDQLDWLIGRDITNIDQLCREVQQRFAHSTTARTGLEIALYDLYARSLNMPLVKLFGQQVAAMPTSITIGIKNVQETLEEAHEYVGRKFRILKIKLGISVEEDIERLVKLRETFGRQVALIIDANQGYDKTSCTRFFDATRHLDIQLIEQPLPAGKEREMTELDEPIKKLIAADESLLTPQQAEQLAGPPAACGFFNIKLMKCGGITPAFDIAAIAARHQIGLMWGCNDESIISITAALHTAFACAHTKFIDLDGSFDLAQDVVQGGFLLRDGIMYVSDLPGLGVQAV